MLQNENKEESFGAEMDTKISVRALTLTQEEASSGFYKSKCRIS